MEIAINNNVYQQAEMYAQQQGMNLSAMIENFLRHFVSKSQTAQKTEVPDIVLSLLGAGSPIGDDDINGREAYYKYLEEKYQ